ncbi:hypothetical protein BDP27DRAFT_1326899 [Rhodocollybia butyracea]|uniref:Uncharacterized protein n=1 Tax=Rhodocollybia butyracea TaxID=206335 RepID=A0A9P5PSI2_9AGAR|nr:hypothetical protein BDP27DRAFT_1326899 [Rhodocollybia butyracea]
MSELWNDWTFKERYPGWKELQEYFHHIDQKWNVRKDISFNTKVVAASFDQEQSRWVVTTESRLVARPRFLVLCVGVCSKVYTPQFEGLDTFGGACYHTARWPKEGVELKGKRIGVIQEVGPQASHLTVFQRTPNMALPMRQKQLDTGFSFDRYPKSFDSTSIEERILHREDLWALGGFHFVVSNFKDFNTTEHGHRETYNFWRDRVRKRIHDPVLQEKLAPPDPIHPIGAKRLSLEQSYYEVFNQKNVKLVDLNECGISKITSKGILTDDGTEHDLNVLVLATGFDSLTGGLADLGIQGVDGTSLAEKWANGVYTTFGMTCANYPNMFFVYGPQAPTAYVNGPSLIEVQCDWVAECIRYMKDNDFLAIYPTHKAEAEWRSTIMDLGSSFAKTVKSSWYFGSNIPGVLYY